MPNGSPYGAVDYSRIAGLRKLFEQATQTMEESAVAQMQVQQEREHQKRLQTAANMYKEAATIADKNPFVANTMVKNIAAALMSSRDKRDQEAGKQYAGMKFDLTPILQKTEEVTIPGYAPTKTYTYGMGEVGPITKVETETPRKIETPEDVQLKFLRMKNLAADLAKKGVDLGGLSLSDLADYKEKLRVAHAMRGELVSRYSEKELTGWAETLNKKAPDLLAGLQQTPTNELDARLMALFQDEKKKDLLSDLDIEKLRAVALYMKNSASVKAYQGMVKDYGLEYDPIKDDFVKLGTVPKGAKVTKSGKRFTPVE